MPTEYQDRDDASSSSSSMLVTNTLLAISDGPIQPTSNDLKTHTSSYIGGYPTFPVTSIPDSITCKLCNSAIPLLTQVYCPLEDGENDRTLYVFACSQSACQRRDGSIRAFRASLRNDAYMADVDAKRAEREKREKEEKEQAKLNPFSIDSGAGAKQGAGLGSQLFGGGDLFGSSAANPFAVPVADPIPETAALSITSDTRPNPKSYGPPLPAYQPAQYLSTFDEYLPDPEAESDDDDDEDVEVDDEAVGAGVGAGAESGKPAGDEVFERFMRRIRMAEGGEGHVLRYDFNSIPLPYSAKSSLYKTLFPSGTEPAAGKYFPVTRPSHAQNSGPALQGDETEAEASRSLAQLYNPSSIPKCPRCKGDRVFELQLVPSLISVLRPHMLSTDGKAPKKDKAGKKTEAERREELRRLADGEAVEGMEWGSVLVFGCVNDCVGFGEEWVGVEWESLK